MPTWRKQVIKTTTSLHQKKVSQSHSSEQRWECREQREEELEEIKTNNMLMRFNEHIGRINLHFVSQVSWPVGSWNRSIHSMWWDYVGLEWQSRDPMAQLLNRWMLNLVEMIRSCSSLMYLEDNVSLMCKEITIWCFLDQNGHLSQINSLGGWFIRILGSLQAILKAPNSISTRQWDTAYTCGSLEGQDLASRPSMLAWWE